MYVEYNVNVMSTIAVLCCLGNNIILRTEREMETGPSHLLYFLSLSLVGPASAYSSPPSLWAKVSGPVLSHHPQCLCYNH